MKTFFKNLFIVVIASIACHVLVACFGEDVVHRTTLSVALALWILRRQKSDLISSFISSASL